MQKPVKLWFVAKNYGWGWRPSTWQGWVVLAVYVAGNVIIFRHVDTASHSMSDTLIKFVLPCIISTAALIGVCYYTGEKPEWRWGKK